MASLNSMSFSCSGDGKIEQAKTENGESGKREITGKSTENKSYKLSTIIQEPSESQHVSSKTL